MGKPSNKQSSKSGNSEAVTECQTIVVRHILCDKQSQILEAEAKVNAGAKFDDVAREMSQDKARQGGLLGKKTKSDLLKPFADVAFKLACSTTANPVTAQAKTVEGYHLIMVESRA